MFLLKAVCLVSRQSSLDDSLSERWQCLCRQQFASIGQLVNSSVENSSSEVRSMMFVRSETSWIIFLFIEVCLIRGYVDNVSDDSNFS